MTQFFELLPTIWPWLLLIIAMVSTVSGKQVLGMGLLGVFGAVSLTLGLVTPIAAGVVTVGFAGALMLRNLSGVWAALGHIALVIWCIALGAHLVPGFHNLLVLDQVQSGPLSRDFTMYLNLDKPMVLFTVALAWPSMIGGAVALRKIPLAVGFALLPALLALGSAVNAIRPEISLPHWWVIFALSNLFLTCLTEEVFFRGYLQSLISSRFGAGLGIAAASLLFGLVHVGGGPALAGFATILGAACGLGYYATGRLWVPVLMHFCFNAAHLVLFTYPGPA
ncbi:type II CAAX endopeptidase family protein [Ruegeria sp. HU-ET01832]|uniref:CPBP family intramembrane glutamic endopeptidase n=1 Tax=Ruegeria sp. HU-ET01832 TaxID=3135906 RepID=UPI00310BF17E